MDWERLNPEEIEAFASGRMLPSFHPHYPFAFIDQVLSAERSALTHLWNWRPKSRTESVTRWCALAKTHSWAWDDCDALLRLLVWNGEEIPEALRKYTRLKRPRRAGRQTTLARDLLIEQIAASLEENKFSRTEAELAITMYLSADSRRRGIDDSTVRKARTRARKLIAKVE